MKYVAQIGSSFLALAATAVLAGCATSQYMKPGPKLSSPAFLPQRGKSVLHLIRRPKFAGSAWIFRNFVDGRFAGDLQQGSYTRIVLEPGTHRLLADLTGDQSSFLSKKQPFRGFEKTLTTEPGDILFLVEHLTGFGGQIVTPVGFSVRVSDDTIALRGQVFESPDELRSLVDLRQLEYIIVDHSREPPVPR